MEILKGIEIIDLCILIDKKTLVIPDLHLGYEETMRKKGVFLPRTQLKITKKRLKAILQETKPKEIIFIGDIKHEFGTLSFEEKSDCFEIIDLTLEYTKNITLIQGNHDRIIRPIAKRKNLKASLP